MPMSTPTVPSGRDLEPVPARDASAGIGWAEVSTEFTTQIDAGTNIDVHGELVVPMRWQHVLTQMGDGRHAMAADAALGDNLDLAQRNS